MRRTFSAMTVTGFLAFTLLVAALTWLATRRHHVTGTSDSYFLGGAASRRGSSPAPCS
jgi:uncharacterized sodium:solute symporter family permease YidK